MPEKLARCVVVTPRCWHHSLTERPLMRHSCIAMFHSCFLASCFSSLLVIYCTPLNVIVVENFATSHHYCPMSVQPLPAFTVTFSRAAEPVQRANIPIKRRRTEKPSAVFRLLKIPNRYRLLLFVPSMPESCFCGSARKTGLRPIFFSCENW